ncbi:MAG: hypothetical protein VZS12_08010 [Ruminococcus bromii]|nr:hypothetical protein [Ruminococcus bromii]
MSKIIDITDKLNFEERPQIKIKDTVVNVNNDATSVLKITAIFEDEKDGKVATSNLLSIYELLFDDEARAEIDKLHLSIDDFTTFIVETASSIIGNGEKPEGETATPATT